MERYDAIVIGTGGVGSSALYHLAKRGLRVLGLDQFPQAHSSGSSHGQSRIIRQAYFEHPDYVPLLLKAYELWDEVENESQRKLFHQVGLLEVGPPDGVLIPGVMQSVQQHSLPIERLSIDEARRRFPFAIPDGMKCVFEPTAGYLLVEQCVQSHLDLAARAGADWRNERVVSWDSNVGHVSVQTESEIYEADRVVFSSGAWTHGLLKGLDIEHSVLPKHQYWFSARGNGQSATSLPTYFFEIDDGYFYGFPQINDRGLKIAQHSGGERFAEPVDLAGRTDSGDELAVQQFRDQYCPFMGEELLSQQACMYTMSPDEHFIVDRHPEHERIVFAAGLSGHGFKFTSVLGSLLADLATDSLPETDIDFLQLGRLL